VEDGLAALPESFAANPQGKLLELCNSFIDCVADCTLGEESDPIFFEGLYEEFGRLSRNILATRPEFDIPKKATRNETAANSLHSGDLDYLASAAQARPYVSTPVTAESDSNGDAKAKCEHDVPG